MAITVFFYFPAPIKAAITMATATARGNDGNPLVHEGLLPSGTAQNVNGFISEAIAPHAGRPFLMSLRRISWRFQKVLRLMR